jgi:hypothetical protein
VGLTDPDDDFALLRTDDDNDRLGHGTACADLILRLAPAASIVPIRVFGGQLETSPAALRAGIEWAAEQAIPLVNLSLGTTLEHERAPLLAACERARRGGMLIVASAPTPGPPPTRPLSTTSSAWTRATSPRRGTSATAPAPSSSARRRG